MKQVQVSAGQTTDGLTGCRQGELQRVHHVLNECLIDRGASPSMVSLEISVDGHHVTTAQVPRAGPVHEALSTVPEMQPRSDRDSGLAEAVAASSAGSRRVGGLQMLCPASSSAQCVASRPDVTPC